MISVISVDNSSKPVAELLIKSGFNTEQTIDEKIISKSNLIIFPNFKDYNKAIKKLHLLNLTSILKTTNKPILALGNGVLALGTKTDSTLSLGLIEAVFSDVSNGFSEIVNIKDYISFQNKLSVIELNINSAFFCICDVSKNIFTITNNNNLVFIQYNNIIGINTNDCSILPNIISTLFNQ